MTDELDKPLGKKKFALKLPKIKLKPKQWPWGRGMLALSFTMVALAVFVVLFIDDPSGGRPSITVPISSIQDANPVAQNLVETISAETQPMENSIALQPEIDSSVEPQVTPDDIMDRPQDAYQVYNDLQEDAKYGMIPRIATSGVTPFEEYSRPSITPAAANGQPLIAILITGMGLNETTTVDAIERLPENVSMAFAPYGQSLQRGSLLARQQGHEVLLEVPMEPFDYPQSDPGPHTLLADQTARKNLDNLFWLMARFGGYIGIVNNLGARFTSSAADFTPIMEELGTRGLGYLDDNTSNRSLSRQLASANKVPFAKSSSTLDTNPSRAEILVKLEQLENQAQQNGSAIGVVSALPVSISTIASWAPSLEEKGIILVPVSALMQSN